MIQEIQNLIQNLNDMSHNQIKFELQKVLDNYISIKTPIDNYLINFSESKESLKNIKEVFKLNNLNLVLYNDLTQTVINNIEINPFSEFKEIYDYQILLNMFEQFKIIDEKVYKIFLSHHSLNLLSSKNTCGNLLNDEQLCKFIDEKSKTISNKIKSEDKIYLCPTDITVYQKLNSSERKEYQNKIKYYAEKMLSEVNLLETKFKLIEKSISIHRIPEGFIFDVSYSTSDKEFNKRKNDKHKIAFFIEKFKLIGYDYYNTFENELSAQNFIKNFEQIKFKFENQ